MFLFPLSIKRWLNLNHSHVIQVRYKSDCEKLYGRILGNHNVVSSVQENAKRRTEDIWSTMYPEEPYELELNRPFSEDTLQKASQSENFTTYDLVSAVKRQIPFTFQVMGLSTVLELIILQLLLMRIERKGLRMVNQLSCGIGLFSQVHH